MFKKNNERVARNINVQKTTSAKRDVNLIFSKNQYFTKKGIDLAYNTKSMPYMVPLISEDQCSPVRQVLVKPLYIAEVLTVRQVLVLREHAHAALE